MKVLITGAFGNLGLLCVEQALAMGYTVRCFDLDNRHSRQMARKFEGRVEVVLGDIRNETLQKQIVEGVEAVIHNASLLPPATETSPDLARSINVDACEALIRRCETAPQKPVFIFPSSVTVFGLPAEHEAPRTAGDPVEATDNYTRHKLAVEALLRVSGIPWVVLRVGVAVDARTLSTDRGTFRQLLDVKPDNPLEYVHPADVAYAMCRAASTEEAKYRVLLLGGGGNCQVTQREFLNTAFAALGIPLPLSVHGSNAYYTHWMDTRESQALLGFQHHDFGDYRREIAAKLAPVKYLLFPVRWVVRALLPHYLRAI